MNADLGEVGEVGDEAGRRTVALRREFAADHASRPECLEVRLSDQAIRVPDERAVADQRADALRVHP